MELSYDQASLYESVIGPVLTGIQNSVRLQEVLARQERGFPAGCAGFAGTVKS